MQTASCNFAFGLSRAARFHMSVRASDGFSGPGGGSVKCTGWWIKPSNGRRNLLPAWKLIRKYARLLTERVSLWISGSNEHTVRKNLRQWEAICRNESLGYLPEDEERKVIELTTLLTYYVVDGVHHLRT